MRTTRASMIGDVSSNAWEEVAAFLRPLRMSGSAVSMREKLVVLQ